MDANKPIWINKEPEKGVEKSVKLMVATPVHSTVSIHYVRALLDFQRECVAKKVLVSFSLLKSSLVTQGRNLCVSQFLESKDDYTHLLFIDSDIEFKAHTIFEMLKRDKEVIACPYPMKTFNWNKIADRLNDGTIKKSEDIAKHGYTFPIKVEDAENIEADDGVIEVTHAPTGCMLIKKQVFEKLIKAYPEKEICQPTIINNKEVSRPYFYNFFECVHDEKTKNYYGEDFGFCRIWTQIGGKCYAYIHDEISHVGDHVYTGRLYDDLISIKKVD